MRRALAYQPPLARAPRVRPLREPGGRQSQQHRPPHREPGVDQLRGALAGRPRGYRSYGGRRATWAPTSPLDGLARAGAGRPVRRRGRRPDGRHARLAVAEPAGPCTDSCAAANTDTRPGGRPGAWPARLGARCAGPCRTGGWPGSRHRDLSAPLATQLLRHLPATAGARLRRDHRPTRLCRHQPPRHRGRARALRCAGRWTSATGTAGRQRLPV